jgi:hypothetical protein
MARGGGGGILDFFLVSALSSFGRVRVQEMRRRRGGSGNFCDNSSRTTRGERRGKGDRGGMVVLDDNTRPCSIPLSLPRRAFFPCLKYASSVTPP